MSSDQENTMLWKVEPLSPSGDSDYDIDEPWLCFDEKPADFEDVGDKSDLLDSQLTRAQVASKFLEELELENGWIKEESFANWLEEKIELPIFEELPAPECGQNRPVIYPSIAKISHQNVLVAQQQHQQQQQHHHLAVDSTQSLLREFETVLGDVEACHQNNSASRVISSLTPPQSPPPLAKQHLLVSLQPLHATNFVYGQQESAVIAAVQHHHQPQHQTSEPQSYSVPALDLPGSGIEQQLGVSQWNPESLSLVPLVHSSEVAQELAKVDEYVRSCAADVVGSPASYSSASPPSPCTSSNASCISSEDSSDPDWCFQPSTHPSTSTGRRASTGASRGSSSGRRSSTKPYSRPNVEDKKVRKKEQNKNAATRYRLKKKQEVKEILSEEQELADKNDKLQDKVKDLQREIGYLKGLMRDLFKAKGLLN
ncbi:hypothetical protein QAD02_019007 [Eretmocerus hayati]|uniref:Uncharacterized protein n=1 Tax=Eretmocerus hayati TaxID=131215 RepID=A0ACC2PHZ4_9HYME|nr:hypothetical protein QAD02_019007 [Eretmocerus hayati]